MGISKQYPTHVFRPVGEVLPTLESNMPLKVILAIGVESSLLEIQSSAWKASGYIVTFAWSVKDAITHFRDGDFDLVLLGHALPAESRERLMFLIRASGAQVPVAFIADSSGVCDRFADATLRGESSELLQEIEGLMSSRVETPTSRSNMPLAETWQSTAR